MLVLLDGGSLSIDDVMAIAGGRAQTALAPAARDRMEASRAVVDRMIAGDAPVYGVNTGVGLLASVRIPREDLDQLQRNVLRSHAAGAGDPLPRADVRAMMAIRANVLAKGCSGIRAVVADRLCEMLNRGVTPVVPSQGSVGASGDLAPLAHTALLLIGEGEAEFEGEVMPGAAAMRRARIALLDLHPKEGISLINGTQAMAAVGVAEVAAAAVLVESADTICALTLDALRGTPNAFDARIHKARPHAGQQASAARLRRLLEGSPIRESHLACRRVQDAYSLRCAPQVHGAVRDQVLMARAVLEVELNSATDNPLVFGDEILSGGNFHGEPLALQYDYLAIALAALAGIAERRIDRLVNPALSEDLPAFLAAHPGLESGLMMVQVTAAALVGELRVLATPATPGSITTSGNQEDFVSMGMTAAMKLRRAVRNTRLVLAIEAMAACHALDLLRPLRSSDLLEEAKARVRMVSPEWTGDRTPSGDIAAIEILLGGGGLVLE